MVPRYRATEQVLLVSAKRVKNHLQLNAFNNTVEVQQDKYGTQYSKQTMQRMALHRTGGN